MVLLLLLLLLMMMMMMMMMTMMTMMMIVTIINNNNLSPKRGLKELFLEGDLSASFSILPFSSFFFC